MTSPSQISEEDLCCPVCYDIFRDPVVLLCSHSVCRACLQQFWSSKGFQECPVCRKRFTRCDPLSNLALKNLCESFLQVRNPGASSSSSSRSEMFCNVHKERLNLFCLDDKHPVCIVCRDSEKHLNHKFRPIDEVVPLLKEELKTTLKHLQEKLKSFKEIKQTFDNTAQYIKTQVQQTVRSLQEEFERLHQFLRDEEMIRISALREEEDQKGHMIKDRIENIDREIKSLSHKITTIENDLGAADITFLQNFRFSLKGAQSTPDPQMLSGALINVAEHLGNLKFKVWEKMQAIVQITPVTLDPNTANPLLVLTDDLTSVKYSTDVQHYPDNPERFDNYYCVLASESFTSGTHSWDVHVGDNTCWSVGVTTASNQRKGDIFFNTGVWRVRYMAGQYTLQSPVQARTPFAVKERLQMIRVQLDWDRGEVSFSDPVTNTHLLTFTTTFTEAVFPFLYSSCTRFPLIILPVKFSITVKVPN
ncbi:E3 ubiquitin-protein ligase TRIM35-like [Myxocyprinus asiaticus]|uniref:E3 ubiquitin-protein ligase TRIM35-like n=1 Tax=Myxocyprinus asiaticus TaxID=70543 RepID=UPI0022237DB2|nr:E3 ubiquitin-protein ligase TRIM35-like [Myxocyprinus asiaticus]